MVTLTGLTEAQAEMCEVLWNLETQHEVDQYMKSLSSNECQMAQTLIQMMIQESVEDQVNSQDYIKEIDDILNDYKSKR